MITLPGISVVIRTKDSGKTLGEVLRRLAPGNNDELLVLDSGSTDETLAIANEQRAKIFEVKGPFNYSKPLNIGFAAATNPWVLVLSSHSIPQSTHYLDDLRGSISRFPENVAVAYGPTHLSFTATASSGNEAEAYVDWDQWAKSREWRVGNGNAVYRLSEWKQHSFDESLVTAEDLEWFIWALRNERVAVMLPGAVVINRNKGSLRHMFRKGLNESKAIRKLIGPNPMGPYGLFIGLASLAKKLLTGRFWFGTFLRQVAHHCGAFLGSRQKE